MRASTAVTGPSRHARARRLKRRAGVRNIGAASTDRPGAARDDRGRWRRASWRGRGGGALGEAARAAALAVAVVSASSDHRPAGPPHVRPRVPRPLRRIRDRPGRERHRPRVPHGRDRWAARVAIPSGASPSAARRVDRRGDPRRVLLRWRGTQLRAASRGLGYARDTRRLQRSERDRCRSSPTMPNRSRWARAAIR